MPPKRRKKAVRKKSRKKSTSTTRRPRRKSTRPKKRSARAAIKPLRLKPRTKKKLNKILPPVKLILVMAIGYLAYAIGTSDVPTQTKTTPTKKTSVQTSVVQKKKTPPKVVTPKKETVQKKVVKKTTPKPKPKSKSKPVVKQTPAPKKTYTPPPDPWVPAVWSSKPKLVFVIDDIGHNLNNEKLYRKLGSHITYAILPLLRHSEFHSRLGKQMGAEVILHLPLETQDGTVPGPGLLTGRMSESYIIERLDRNLKSVPDHVGANNHMGSYGTTDSTLMRAVLKEIKRRGLFFLDSYTTASSVVRQVSYEIGLPVLKRDIFLDNVDNQAAVRKQLHSMEDMARRQGYAIAIGHDRHNTLTVIYEELPRLKAQGFEIISLRQLLDYKRRRR